MHLTASTSPLHGKLCANNCIWWLSSNAPAAIHWRTLSFAVAVYRYRCFCARSSNDWIAALIGRCACDPVWAIRKLLFRCSFFLNFESPDRQCVSFENIKRKENCRAVFFRHTHTHTHWSRRTCACVREPTEARVGPYHIEQIYIQIIYINIGDMLCHNQLNICKSGANKIGAFRMPFTMSTAHELK